MSYLLFIRQNLRFLGFGFTFVLFCSAGQTFFLGLFSGDIRAEFGLSHGDYGMVFSAATICSALTMMQLGARLDRFDLRPIVAVILGALVAACLLFASAGSIAVLAIAIYLLRLTGQGLMNLTANTAMARYFDTDRGKAVSTANLGFPVGEAIFPLMAVSAVALWGWRPVWVAIAAIMAVLVLPLSLYLLRGHGERHRRHQERVAARAERAAAGETPAIRQWSRAEVLRDSRFYLLLPCALSSSFLATAIIFHQVHLVESKGWSLQWFAGNYILAAIAAVIGNVAVGWLVDRFSAVKLLPIGVLPLAAAFAVIAVMTHPIAVPLFMLLYGTCSGLTRTISGTVWAEIYGVRHFGSIRAFVTSLTAMGSGVSPALVGWMLDAGVSMVTILWLSAALALAASGSAVLALRRPAPA